MSSKLILVTGATGKQGRALIAALRPLSAGDTETAEPNPFHILALTRNSNSPLAKELAQEKHVDVVQGNLDDAQSVRKVFEEAKENGGIWGVFCVLAFPGLGAPGDGEEKQGKTLADLALEYKVSHFIYSSAERGGESYDDKSTLDRRAKVNIERHIRELGTKGLSWTILRPGFFMENFEGTIGAITVGVLKTGLKPDTTIQLIAADDIGHVAAGVFNKSEPHTSNVLVVVGDVCTTAQLEEAYKTATGRSISSTPSFLAGILIKINRHTQDLLKDLERVHSTRIGPSHEEIAVQIAAAKDAYPEIKTFGTWAAQRKTKESKWENNWNQVSIGRLLMGKH